MVENQVKVVSLHVITSVKSSLTLQLMLSTGTNLQVWVTPLQVPVGEIFKPASPGKIDMGLPYQWV